MNVLIAVASRHGSTTEIAEAIALDLRAAGIEATLRWASEVESLDDYDALILGSAVYMGNWMTEARHFVERHRDALARMPVWLFSSGPVGADDPKPHGDPSGLAELMAATGARGHHIFAGRLDPTRLGLGERLIVKAVRAPAGDFRDWKAVRAWADEIAAALAVPAR